MIEELTHFHLFAGLGGGARGFNRGHAKVGGVTARFRCLGGVDSDAAAIRDFERLAKAKGTVLDLFSREQYAAFHGRPPGDDWREATPDDLRRAACGERPNIVFTSPPCKGFSGLLSQEKSLSLKYQALNGLAFRGVWLALEAWGDDPPEFFLLENVPRIATRGRHLVEQLKALLDSHGYSANEETYDCGEIGGLGQTRKRFLLAARHRAKVPCYLFEPPRRRLRSVGEVLGDFPLPGDPGAGLMHRLPQLTWKTWLRLAFVEAGSDWRSLQRLRVTDGVLADYGIAPEAEFHNGMLGVLPWSDTAGTVTAQSLPNNGRFAVQDPRAFNASHYYQLGVKRFTDTAAAVTGQNDVGGGPYAIADPRLDPALGARFNNVYRVVEFATTAQAVTGGGGPTAGGQAVADPRPGLSGQWGRGHFGVARFDEPAGAVIASGQHDNSPASVADPRCTWGPNAHRNKLAVGRFEDPARPVIGATRPGSGAACVADPRFRADADHFSNAVRVTAWSQSAPTVVAQRSVGSGSGSVADPRIPEAKERLVAVIRALDGTWHRPFTTLELAALQGLVDVDEQLELSGKADTAWRERIGNAVPSPAAEAIAGVMALAILRARRGEVFALDAMPVWTRPLVALVATEVPS